jgi:hypothetical protein
MTSTTKQLWLARQYAAPEGPVDMSMMYVMHHAFRRDLEAFAAAVPQTPVDDSTAWRALRERWGLFATALHHHHSGEDAWLWPALLERADEQDRTTLEAMEEEHGQIDPLLQACAAGLAEMVARPSEDQRNALAIRLVAARESLGRHLQHEEGDAMAILQRVFSHEDWEEIDARFKRGLPFGQVVKLVPWVLHELPREVREGLFAETGLVHRVIWLMTRRRFERQDAIAFAHRT